MTMEFPIAGFTVRVDPQDAPVLLGRSWYIQKRTTRSGRLYAYVVANKKRLMLHCLLMDAKPGQVVDHVDGDGLNNTRGNLRVCTHAENMRNRRATHGRELPKGVQRRKGGGFAAQIRAARRARQMVSIRSPGVMPNCWYTRLLCQHTFQLRHTF